MRPAGLSALAALALALYPSGSVAQTRCDFDDVPDRVWIGRDFWANRLQDWRVRDGRLECLESRKDLPMRTAHVLTRALAARPGKAEVSVRLGPLDPDADHGPHAAAGLLLGAGGIGIDPRLTAQVHHAPAEDGGLVVLVEPSGKLSIRRNDRSLGETPLWSLNVPVGPEQLPVLGEGVSTPAAHEADEYTLVLTMNRGQTRARIAARVQDAAGEVLSFAIAEVEPGLVDGCIALVSTGGPDGSPAGFWFDDLVLDGDLISAFPARAFGPVWHAMYVRDGDSIGLTAQFPPLAPLEGEVPTSLPDAELWVEDDGWRRVASSPIVPDSWTATFRLEEWDTGRDTAYQVRFAEPTRVGGTNPGSYAGVFRAAPDLRERPYVIGSLNCNKTYTGGLRWNRSGLWFPHDDLVANLAKHDPDLLFFAGDQIYEGDLTPVDARSDDILCLDYLYKWTKWCWAFAPVTRDRPTVAIPDDHDVYHGNIWGAGGRRAESREGVSAQDAGGYKHSPRFVNAVHRTQTSHLPPSRLEPATGGGYSTYTTRFLDAGVSFAVLADRMFKESPTIAVPEGEFRNGWPQAEGFDARAHAGNPATPLLGDGQEAFLREWATDWSGDTWMKVALSQSPLAGAHTLPADARDDSVVPGLPIVAPGEYPPDDLPAADADTNGWPRPARDRAVEALRRGFAIHLAGDQHLSTLLRYGLDDWRDAGTCFTSPAIANTWPRRWFPSEPRAGQDPTLGEDAPRYTGDFIDGFGNKLTMLAAANPVRSGREPAGLYDKAPGYGIVRLDRRDRTIRYESWPRWVDPAADDAACYEGWPVTMRQGDNCGSSWEWRAFDSVSVDDLEQHVLTVRRTGASDVLYSIRLYEGFVPRLPDAGPWDFELRNTASGETAMHLTDIPASRDVQPR